MDNEQASRQRSLVAPAFFVLGLVLQLLLVLASPYMAFVSGIRSDACSSNCAYNVIDAGAGLAVGAPIAVLIAVVTVAAIRRHKHELPWLPYAGIGITSGLWWLAFEITSTGLPGGALAP